MYLFYATETSTSVTYTWVVRYSLHLLWTKLGSSERTVSVVSSTPPSVDFNVFIFLCIFSLAIVLYCITSFFMSDSFKEDLYSLLFSLANIFSMLSMFLKNQDFLVLCDILFIFISLISVFILSLPFDSSTALWNIMTYLLQNRYEKYFFLEFVSNVIIWCLWRNNS